MASTTNLSIPSTDALDIHTALLGVAFMLRQGKCRRLTDQEIDTTQDEIARVLNVTTLLIRSIQP